MAKKIDISNHILVPKHILLTAEEKDALLARFNISIVQLPEIKTKDPQAKLLNAKIDDVIKIDRGRGEFFRRVVE